MTSTDGPAASSRFNLMGYLRTPSRSRKILIWLCSLALLAAAVLVALPIGAARYLEDWLKDNGAAAAKVDNVDINLFTGVVRISGLDASGGPRERLKIGSAELNLRWWPLASQRVYVQSLRLTDAQIDVIAEGGQRLQIGAVTVPAGDEANDADIEVIADGSAPWGFGSELVRVANVAVTYRDSVFDTEVELRELGVGSQFTWEAGRSTDLVLDMMIDGSPLQFNSDVLPWADERRLSGALSLKNLNLADYRQVLQEMAGVAEPRGSISLDFRLSAAYRADGGLELRIAGPLEVTNAAFTLGTNSIANQALKWDGEVALRLPAPDNQPLLQVDGDLQLAGTQATLGDLKLTAELGSLGWNGSVGLTPPRAEGTAPNVTVRSQISGRGFALAHADLPFALASLEELVVTGIEVDADDRARAKQVRLQGLRLLAETADGGGSKPDIVSVQQLEVNDVGFDARAGISAASVMLSNPVVTLVRDEQGEFERIAAVTTAFTAADSGADGTMADVDIEPGGAAVADRESAVAPTRISIAEFRLQADSLLSFADRSVSPPATFKLTATQLSVKDLDSSGDKPMQVSLATGDGSLQLTMTGTVNAFAPTPSAELVIDLSALDLPQISSYLPGYNIERGRFSTDSKVVIKGDALEVNNALVVEKLKLSGKAAEGTDAIAQGMAMPLDVALDLLRDGDDRIVLELPVSGSLSDPKFDTGDIVRTAMQKALQNAAMSYVKNALQPLGTLLMVSNLASKAARPRFEPVSMAAGDASLSADSRAYLNKLGGLLNERPGLQLTICSVAAPADREALASMAMKELAVDSTLAEATPRPAGEEPEVPATGPSADAAEALVPVVTDAALLELAGSRTSAVIGYLADEEKVARDRLFACRDTVEHADSGGPRVEISL